MKQFLSYFCEGQTVLDVGVSSESEGALPARNYFLKKYPYDSGTYTGLGVQDLSGMENLFEGKNFIQYSGGKFPFANNEFDWVFSNAVIEHVGDDDSQLFFLNEMMRVAKNVFFTTPSKYFPVESHTNLILLHWNNMLFYNWIRRKRPGMSKDNLYLFSSSRLRFLLEKSKAKSFTLFKNRFFGLTMTFTVVCSASSNQAVFLSTD